jgi:hypothetical protein
MKLKNIQELPTLIRTQFNRHSNWLQFNAIGTVWLMVSIAEFEL